MTGVDNVTNQVTFNYVGAVSWGRDTAVFSTNAGITLEPNVTDVRLLYPLGGFLNLSGLRANSLMGPDFAIARLLFYRQIGRGGPGYFDVPTYLGVSFEEGNVWQRRGDMSFGNTHKDFSIFLGMDTFLGPVYVATGFDQHGERRFICFWGGRSRGAWRRLGASAGSRGPAANHECRAATATYAPSAQSRRTTGLGARRAAYSPRLSASFSTF